LYAFPAFAEVLGAVSNPSGFSYLIYVSFILTIAMFVLAVSFIGRNGRGGYRDRPLPFVIVPLAVTAIVVYYLLFTPLDWFAVNGQQMSYILSTSPALFGFFYCLVVPVFVGWGFGLTVKAAIAVVGKLTAPSSRSTQSNR
jgi:hypothetical protein